MIYDHRPKATAEAEQLRVYNDNSEAINGMSCMWSGDMTYCKRTHRGSRGHAAKRRSRQG